MAYREVDMWEILEVLRRLHRGETHAAIERGTGRTRKTIRRYKQRAGELGWEPGGEREPDEELAVAVGQSLRPVSETEGLGAIEAKLMARRTTIAEWVSPADGSRGCRPAPGSDQGNFAKLLDLQRHHPLPWQLSVRFLPRFRSPGLDAHRVAATEVRLERRFSIRKRTLTVDSGPR